MGFFSRKSDTPAPANPEAAELGREYAIAKRHGDRKAANKILRQIGASDLSDADRTSFQQGRESYDAIPPKPRGRNSRRK
ncbi:MULTISPECIES: hypothetical protein [unclassified Streptomyces]|uniref:hypothetical protein n=1 Tax=unclassified Streptomyces TaxID=2593676 RepID=UPI000DD689AE|nr:MULTISPECIES: hypothetical protein [unclassified Streptomyces]QZZ28158.1 hypothetical protein A7X85_19440 [Streptomyces sp. ST1015]